MTGRERVNLYSCSKIAGLVLILAGLAAVAFSPAKW